MKVITIVCFFVCCSTLFGQNNKASTQQLTPDMLKQLEERVNISQSTIPSQKEEPAKEVSTNSKHKETSHVLINHSLTKKTNVTVREIKNSKTKLAKQKPVPNKPITNSQHKALEAALNIKN